MFTETRPLILTEFGAIQQMKTKGANPPPTPLLLSRFIKSFIKITFFSWEQCAVPFCEESSNISVAFPGITYNPYGVQETIEV